MGVSEQVYVSLRVLPLGEIKTTSLPFTLSLLTKPPVPAKCAESLGANGIALKPMLCQLKKEYIFCAPHTDLKIRQDATSGLSNTPESIVQAKWCSNQHSIISICIFDPGFVQWIIHITCMMFNCLFNRLCD